MLWSRVIACPTGVVGAFYGLGSRGIPICEWNAEQTAHCSFVGGSSVMSKVVHVLMLGNTLTGLWLAQDFLIYLSITDCDAIESQRRALPAVGVFIFFS